MTTSFRFVADSVRTIRRKLTAWKELTGRYPCLQVGDESIRCADGAIAFMRGRWANISRIERSSVSSHLSVLVAIIDDEEVRINLSQSLNYRLVYEGEWRSVQAYWMKAKGGGED